MLSRCGTQIDVESCSFFFFYFLFFFFFWSWAHGCRNNSEKTTPTPMTEHHNWNMVVETSGNVPKPVPRVEHSRISRCGIVVRC